jgi:deferrochelatase/peroxidase EfeB
VPRELSGVGAVAMNSKLAAEDLPPGHSYRPDASPPSIFGAHQAGIASRQLDRLAFGAFDLTVKRLAELRGLMGKLSTEAERLMTAGNGLTVTLGLGPSVFDQAGRDRFGLRSRRPVALRELPAFTGDALDPALSGGDLCLTACADDGDAATAALRSLAGVARAAATERWSQEGFLLREGTGARTRDLLGFRDSTDNLRSGRQRERHVWATTRERTWMAGGTFLVVRRIRIDLDEWNRLPAPEQERVIGRHKESGVPLGGRREFEVPRPESLPPDSHIRLAAPRANEGAAILRRSYNFDNGDGDAGLLLMTYQRDPRRQFVPLQRRLAEHDALSRFTRHTGSAVFAIPPGARPGGFIAEGLVGGAGFEPA